MHPLLKWTIYSWPMASIMAACILLAGHFFDHGVAWGVAVAWLIRNVVERNRSILAFRRVIGQMRGKGMAETNPRNAMRGSWVSDWPYSVYLALLFCAMLPLPHQLAAATVVAALPFSRMVSSQLVLMLPYRGHSQSAPERYSTVEGLLLFAVGMIPVGFLLWYAQTMLGVRLDWSWLVFAPCLVMYALYMLLARRLQGYTYDALTFVAAIVELAFVATVTLSCI